MYVCEFVCPDCNTKSCAEYSEVTIKCPQCGAIIRSHSNDFCTLEDIAKDHEIISNFGSQLLAEHKETEKLVAYMLCGENKYKKMG